MPFVDSSDLPKTRSQDLLSNGSWALLGNGFAATFAAIIYEKDIAMKFLQLLTIVSALFMVFGRPAPSARADDKPGAAHAPFRLMFNSYDGDPKKDAPDKFTFGINTIDLKQPSEFLEIGDIVRKTKWKLAKFVYKTRPNPKTNELDDVSELTLVDTETKEEIVLILNRVTDTAHPPPKK